MPLVEIFDSAGDIFSVTLIWLLGFLITHMVSRFLAIRFQRAMILYIWHSLLCLLFTKLTHFNGADSVNYYLSALSGDVSFKLGTPAVSLIAFIPVKGLHLSYFGANLLFSILSMVGLLFIDAVLKDLKVGKRQVARLVCSTLVFFPSVHFWTGAVGKDGFMLLGAGLIIWAGQSIQVRYVALFLGVLLFVIVRPHMAVFFILAYGISAIMGKNVNLVTNVLMLVVLGAGLYLLAPFVLSLIGLESSKTADVLEYINNRQSYENVGGSAISLQSMNPLQRSFAFLFRPTLIEVRSVLTLVSAVENAILVMSVVILGFSFSFTNSQEDSRYLGRGLMLIYGIVGLIVLGQLTYNLGLAARQKWMVLPFILVALVAYSRTSKAWAHQMNI